MAMAITSPQPSLNRHTDLEYNRQRPSHFPSAHGPTGNGNDTILRLPTKWLGQTAIFATFHRMGVCILIIEFSAQVG